MAVVLGTNSGFVTVAPTDDPAGTSTTIDNMSYAEKDTSPATASKITKIGWYCNNATQEANFEVGLYSHDADHNKPGSRLYLDNTNAKGTNAGWKEVIVDWDIEPDTVYWLAAGVANTASATSTDYTAGAAPQRFSIDDNTNGSLQVTWAASTEVAGNAAIYAVWESAADDKKDHPILKDVLGSMWGF